MSATGREYQRLQEAVDSSVVWTSRPVDADDDWEPRWFDAWTLAWRYDSPWDVWAGRDVIAMGDSEQAIEVAVTTDRNGHPVDPHDANTLLRSALTVLLHASEAGDPDRWQELTRGYRTGSDVQIMSFELTMARLEKQETEKRIEALESSLRDLRNALRVLEAVSRGGPQPRA